ncbi:hypothetical protein EV193_111225 [Herbihabitans rhizosphaerae]|uniref:DUF5313 family protein n=1 Tax=Herbihabitans rhizosphaerae TaxID=1872711 RepID=A0A4Q7KFT8_9PSEU|nr:DUF5313 family protein [Herbihabitans rhizosphaerae]RZS32840.1 hypothetical protein EV193_111225 [Herbihabitans rhizosphaerae]
MDAISRPGPLRWLRYAYGGRLPDRYRAWVLRDATAPHWRWRYALRVLAETAPFLAVGFLVLMLLPVPVAMALAALGFALVMTLAFTLAQAEEFRADRLVQHGFPPDTGRRSRR